MGEYIISLDCGKHSVKCMGKKLNAATDEVKKIKFRTKLYDLEKGFAEVEGNSYKVIFNNKTYIIGEQGKETPENYKTNKSTFLHQICAYTSIVQFLEPKSKENKINLVLACPVSILSEAAAKEKYKNFIKGNGPIKINVNNEKYEFEIVDITLKAEGSGVLYMKEELFRNSKVALIDFGGLNMSFSLYNNGVCRQENRFAEVHGAIHLTNNLAKVLTSYKEGEVVQPIEAEEILEVGHMTIDGSIDKESIAAINKCKKDFFDEAVEKIERNNYKLSSIQSLVFVGGTTKNIENQIKSKYTHSVIENEWTTCEGLFKVANLKYSKAKASK